MSDAFKVHRDKSLSTHHTLSRSAHAGYAERGVYEWLFHNRGHSTDQNQIDLIVQCSRKMDIRCSLAHFFHNAENAGVIALSLLSDTVKFTRAI